MFEIIKECDKDIFCLRLNSINENYNIVDIKFSTNTVRSCTVMTALVQYKESVSK